MWQLSNGDQQSGLFDHARSRLPPRVATNDLCISIIDIMISPLPQGAG